MLFGFVFVCWRFGVYPFTEELFMHDGYGIHLFAGIGYTAFQILTVNIVFSQGLKAQTLRFYLTHALVAVVLLEALELLQYFDPSRRVQLGDFVAQTLGVLITSLVLWLTERKKAV